MDGHPITVGGATQSGAVDVQSTVTAKHDAIPLLVRLNPGVTADQAFAFATSKAGRDPNNAPRVGSIVFSADARKGTSNAETTLEPGNYLVVDVAGNNPKKFPHTSLTISQASAPATLPNPGATVRAIDFGFRGASTLH
jgi:hypothetical protein